MSKSKYIVVFCIVLLVTLATANDGLEPRADPSYGERQFSPGFQPAPFSIDVFSGGDNDVAALDLGENCLGYAASPPDFVLELTDTFDQITILADSEVDTTLIVNTANGSWACNDDTNGLNPALVLHYADAGLYQVWIGSYSEDSTEISTLWITELGPDTLPTTATGPDLTRYPTDGEIALSPGFEPAPTIKQIVGGGHNFVADHVPGENCAGFVAEAPGFSVKLREDFETIWFSVHSPANMTLLLNSADDEWYCSDDVLGANPGIGFENAAAGRYDIWVGSYDHDNYAAALIYMSEFEPDGSLDFIIDTSCPGMLPTPLQVGHSVAVSRPDDGGMPIHAMPNSAASNVFYAESGTRLTIVGGPICSEEHRWWRIAIADVPRGWAPDGDGSESWLQWVASGSDEASGGDTGG